VGDPESYLFELLVAVSENGIVLGLYRFNNVGDIYAACVLDRR